MYRSRLAGSIIQLLEERGYRFARTAGQKTTYDFALTLSLAARKFFLLELAPVIWERADDWIDHSSPLNT